MRDCRCVELRALCDEVPRTPPGPEGSNGTGIASCAAEYPKFLSSKMRQDILPALPFGERSKGFLCDRLCSSVFSVLSFCLSGFNEHELPGHRAEMAAA